MNRTTAPLLLVLLAAPACGGGGGGGDAQGEPDAGLSPSCLEATQHSDFAWIRDNVFNRSCANFTSCHDSVQPAGGLDLTPEAAHANLVNVPSMYFTDWMRVAPGNCDASYLLVRLRCHSDTMPTGEPCVMGPLDGGQLMPPNSSPLCQEKVDAICRWITAGAPAETPDAAPPDGGQ